MTMTPFVPTSPDDLSKASLLETNPAHCRALFAAAANNWRTDISKLEGFKREVVSLEADMTLAETPEERRDVLEMFLQHMRGIFGPLANDVHAAMDERRAEK